MKEIPLKDGQILSSFFQDAYDSCPDSFLQGVMGRGFTDSLENPSYGIIQVGDFFFLGGDGSGSHKKNIISILKNLYKNPDMILVPLSESWNNTLSKDTFFYKDTRYALDRPDISSFDTKCLSDLVNEYAYNPDSIEQDATCRFMIKPINEHYYIAVQNQLWSKDFTRNYPDYITFQKLGFGFVAIETATGIITSGASSFSSSLDSIEIEIATNPDFRKCGLATAISARMVLECIRRGKYPSWDAANLISVRIAEKLGYHFKEEYICYKQL